MRQKTSNWFEVKVNYRRLSEEGSEVSVTETIVKEAESFEETERYAHCMMEEFGVE